MFFSTRNPLLRWKLPLLHKWLYNNGTWSYFCTIVTTWTFLLVPFISLMFEIQPVKFGRQFALAATLYLCANTLVSGRAWLVTSTNSATWARKGQLGENYHLLQVVKPCSAHHLPSFLVYSVATALVLALPAGAPGDQAQPFEACVCITDL